MNKNQVIVAANWKMQLSFSKTIEFCSTNRELFAELSKKITLICCPSFTALHAVVQLFNNTAVFVGAQNCSSLYEGAYTGEESAQSLAQIGCSYCIIGHSERRMYYNDTSIEVATKLVRLLEQKIIPIICIGENNEEYKKHETYTVLRYQLEPIFNVLASYKQIMPAVVIAYEPVWSIGTGNVPSREYLAKIFQWLSEECATKIPTKIHLLYGGSVNIHNVQEIIAVGPIDGVLIGSASLDFQNFKNIVSLLE